ncbi:hypothetical protein SDC9_163048 [bioreactor metagenome]|uniref:Uncharacterized protein n=1 Tax=bioreactor metagenome TaxID=1076179 RepID=A0A645FUP1_9ZZZZ
MRRVPRRDHRKLRQRLGQQAQRLRLQGREGGRFSFKGLPRGGAGGGKAGDLGRWLGARAQAPLLPAAPQQRDGAQTLPDIERADALGRADLVAADGEQVDTQLRRREGYL